MYFNYLVFPWFQALQAESLMTKVQTFGVEIFEFLKCSDQSLPIELSSAFLEVLIVLKFDLLH